MIELDFLTGLGLDGDTAGALLDLIVEEQSRALEAAKTTQPTQAEQTPQYQTLPRVVAVTPGGAGEQEPERFAAMGYRERARLRAENPALYDKLAHGADRG